MADNFAWTEPGSGTTLAADTISGVDYQRCKLSVGRDGEAADLDGGADRGAWVTERPFIAHTARLYACGSRTGRTYTDGMAFSSGYWNLNRSRRVPGSDDYPAGVLRSLTLIDTEAQGPTLDLIFSTSRWKPKDGAVLAPPDAELATICGHVHLASSDWMTFGTTKVAAWNGRVVLPRRARWMQTWIRIGSTVTYTSIGRIRMHAHMELG